MPYQSTKAKDIMSKGPATQEEIDGIVNRLSKTHTKSSAGGEMCKTMEELKAPGYGQKMLPAIEGLEGRFKGAQVEKSKEDEVIQRLHSAHTKSWKSKLDHPKILLFPERTLLCNNVERIKMFQESGQTVKQNILERREKWYN